jgi:hypothetical protein
VGLESRSSGTRSPKWSQPAETALNPAEAPIGIDLALFLVLSSIGQNIFLGWLEYGAMACIPMAYPPMSPVPKSEPESTPQPSFAPAWKLPNLGPYPTRFPFANGVQKQMKKRAPRPPYQQKMGSIAHLSPAEQVVQLRLSRKAIKSKLYSRIARLQVGAPASTTVLDTPMLIFDKA